MGLAGAADGGDVKGLAGNGDLRCLGKALGVDEVDDAFHGICDGDPIARDSDTRAVGALLVTCGLLYMAGAAIYRGRLTESHSSPREPAGLTLEPRHRGLRFLGLKANWPGLLIAAIGTLMLLFPLV